MSHPFKAVPGNHKSFRATDQRPGRLAVQFVHLSSCNIVILNMTTIELSIVTFGIREFHTIIILIIRFLIKPNVI